MSQKKRVNYVKRQVERISPNKDILILSGDFQYKENMFALNNLASSKYYRWDEIENIVAYKVDLMTTDDVRLDISFVDAVLTISEDIAGWNLFLENLMTALPSIPKDWEQKVIETPFAANTTLIYKK